MNLDLYNYFYYIAKCGSVSKAAEQLYITQPALSKALKQLEEGLGCSLFFRTPKGVKLTQEGEILYRYTQQIFNFMSIAEKKISDIKNLMDGEIKIGASDTLCKYYLIPYLKLFKSFHPLIKVHVTCPTTPGIVSLLKAGKIDFGLINMPYDDNLLEFKNIMEIQDCFIAGEKYRHLSSTMQNLKSIVEEPILLLEKTSNSRDFIDNYFEKNAVSVVPDFELGNIDLLIQFAKFDFGIACVIKNFIEDELEKGRLYEIKPIEKIPPRNIGVAWLKNVPLSAAAKELIRTLEYVEPTEF